MINFNLGKCPLWLGRCSCVRMDNLSRMSSFLAVADLTNLLTEHISQWDTGVFLIRYE